MVLKIFSNNSVFVYRDIDKSFFQTHSYGGMKYLQFDISIKHSLYRFIAEEVRLEYDNQYYLIKGINERSISGICTVNAELDLTGLENKVYLSKTWITESFAAFTSDILSGTGWTISNATLIGKRTTIEAKDETPRQLLDRCSNSTSYGVCFEFDTKNKTITCIKPENNTTPTGVYFTDELNLTELALKGSSASLVTKLYPVGKDGLTIASVNEGKDYIENYTYTDKVVCAVWRDERYTDAQSLKDDGDIKLEALAKPIRSYTCKVVNLAKTNPDIFGTILPIALYDIETLVDRNRGSRIDHRIVELKEYPADHTLDTVTLSTVTGRISGTIATINNRITELDAQQLHDRTKVNEIKQDMDTTVLRVSESWASAENSSMITQTARGLYFNVEEVVGQNQWGTKIQQSASDICIAWNSISNYIKLENAELNIYNSSNSKIISYGSSGQVHHMGSSAIGRIGAYNYRTSANLPGLQFYVNSQTAKFIGWGCGYLSGSQESNYKWLYAVDSFDQYDADTLNANCDINVHSNKIKNATLDNWNFSGGAITGTLTGYLASQMNSDGTAASWRSISLTFKNGILQRASW